MTEQLVLDPEKHYFKIGEISAITGLKPYVLRFWESEFKQIRPGRTLSGQRVYKKRDLEIILKIKHLLYEKKFTIPGAKARLNHETKGGPAPVSSGPGITLAEIREDLLSIRRIMD